MNVHIENDIQEKILQIAVGKKFCFNDIFSEYPSLDDRTKREMCYYIYSWLERNDFVELRQTFKNVTPYNEECLLLMEEKLVLKSSKDNFLNFRKLDFEYKCASGLPRELQQFKISKKHLAYLSPKSEKLIIIDDPDIMEKIYFSFMTCVKKSKKQINNKRDTGCISESLWKKKKIFQKVPDAGEMTDYLIEILKQYIKI